MFKGFSSFRLFSGVTLVLFCVHIFSPFTDIAFADDTTYYVDATGGNDTNDGLSDTSAWKTLAFVNTQTFGPGDQILLKCGESWPEMLVVSTSGASGNPIVYGSYGTCTGTNKPKLSGTGTYHIQFLSGASDVSISGLTFLSGASTHISLLDAGNTIAISDSLFQGGTTGIALGAGSDVTITHNTFQNITASSIETSSGSTANIIENYFNTTQTGITNALRLSDFSHDVSVTGNTFSGANVSLAIKNSANHTIAANTFYSPDTYAITIVEDNTVPTGTTDNIIVSNNTFLTWHPDYSMIRVDDQNDAVGTLATFSGNHYLNVYKALLPVVEVLKNGASTQTYSKDTIKTLDTTATIFPHFGYKNYTSTGVLNTRARETYLLVNTGGVSANIGCPSGVLCGQYVNTSSGRITFPDNVPAYSSKIIFWNNAPNILHIPTCELGLTGFGTIGNGQPVSLIWTVTGATSATMNYPTSTGFTTIPVAFSASGEFYPPNVNGVANIYTLLGKNDIGSSLCTADIRTSNLPPILSVVTATGVEDALTITGQLVASDSSGDTLTYYPDSFPLTGSLNVASGGSFEYAPPLNFCGQITFNWNASDGQATAQDVATATVDIVCTNDAPIALDDTANGTGGVTQNIDVLANDSDPDNGYTFETFTLSGFGGPSHGTLSVVGSQFQYTPDINYYGGDSFMYTATDQSGAVSNTGTVTLSIAPGTNLAPVVSSGSISGNEDTQLVGTFSGSDINGDTLSFSATTLPLHGVLGIAGNSYTYTPNADFNGSDSFTFVANDGALNSSGATISLTIFPVEDFPIATNDTLNVEMNTTSQLDVLINDIEPDGQSMTLTGITTPINGTAIISGNRIQYTPTNGYLGSDSIDYVMEDQNGNLSNTGTVTLNVTTTNQFPAADSGTFLTDEDTALTATLSGSDPDLTPVTFVLDQNVTHGTLSFASTGGFLYTPHLNFTGTDTFTFHVSDGVLSSSIQTVTITVNSLNDAPIAYADSFTGVEDATGMLLTPLANDSDPDNGDTFSLFSFASPGHGTLTQSGDTLVYIPTTDYCGMDSFTYTIQDTSSAVSLPGTVNIALTCVNDAPLAGNMSFSTLGNIVTQSGNTLTGTLSGSDIDGPSLVFALDIPGTAGSTTVTSTGYFEYMPNIGYTGSDSFTYTVSDGTFTTTGTVNLSVLPNTYNAVPTAFSGSFTLAEDQFFAASLSGFDLEGVPLTYVLDQNTTHGTVSLSSTGYLTYTPNLNFNGGDTFVFHVSDGVHVSSGATGTLTITPVNDAPITVNDIATGTEDMPLSIAPLINDSDIEGNPLSLVSFTSPLRGTLTQSGNVLIYTPTSNSCGVDTFDYTISDGALLSNTGTVNIALTCVNDAPLANNDVVSAVEDTPLLIPVIANDTEVDVGDTLTIVNLTPIATGGTVQVSGTGVLYTPSPNFCTSSPLTFTYRVRDTANALSNTVTGTITSVDCVDDIPVAQNASYLFTSNSGAVLTGSLIGTDVDGDALTYLLQVTPSTGSISLTSTGYFSYTISPNYSGLDTLSFLVNDGTNNSASATLSICIVPPSGTPRPACAPAIPPVVSPSPTAGPGGGGGGGGGASVPTLASYDSVSVGGVKNPLVSQLILSRSRTHTGTTLSNSIDFLATTSYQRLVQGITDIVNPGKTENITATLQAQKIRSFAHAIARVIMKSPDASAAQKVSGFVSAQQDMIAIKNSSEQLSTSTQNAFVYIIRLFRAKSDTITRTFSLLRDTFL